MCTFVNFYCTYLKQEIFVCASQIYFTNLIFICDFLFFLHIYGLKHIFVCIENEFVYRVIYIYIQLPKYRDKGADQQTCHGGLCSKKPKNSWPTKIRKYDPAYIKYGFTAIQKNGHDCPKCVLCLETLSNACLNVRS